MATRARDVAATTDEWRRLGKDDPLFAVAAHDGKRGAWAADDFYNLGASDWEDFSTRWREHSGDLAGTVVEIGSGAGRITKHLTQTFDWVVGLDVSPDMIALAKDAAPGAEFHVVDGTDIPLTDGTADAVFTCHVLQHLENLDVVTDYLTEMHRVLRPGGTVMVHFLLTGEPRPLPRRVWAEAKLRAVRARGLNRGAYSRVRRYRPDEVRGAMTRAGFGEVELREFAVRSDGTPHAFWFGRR